MAAAYASLVRLSNLIINIRNHPRFSNFFDNVQIQYLLQNVDFLLEFVENYDSHGSANKEETEDLEEQIASAAYAAETLTENYIQDQIIGGSTQKKRLAYLLALHQLIVDMDFIKDKVMEVKPNKQASYCVIAAPSRPHTFGMPTMVGFDDELFQLKDLLTRQPSGLIIIPIVGMGGIGKTTLAQNAFQHLFIMQNFDIRLWATISQVYSVREILLQLLSSMQRNFSCETVHELGEQLYKSLCGRRYLIVLDDMWSIDVWDKIKVFCPNNGERGRVVVTTRLSNVATHCSSSCIVMKFLDEDTSWKLLCKKVFGEEECPNRELEEIGKEIVKKCNGLPLSIVVIGGHLRNSSMTKEYWLEIANDINSVLDSGEDEQCFSILRLSYSHLPAHLKPCFLCIGLLPEEVREINNYNLVRFWVVEGFLKQSKTQSLEEVAQVYIKDLLDRNLLLVQEWDQRGRVYTFKIHDLLRDLCLMVAEKEKFVSVLRFSERLLMDNFTIEDAFGVVYPGAKFEQVCLRYLDCKVYKTAPCLYIDSSVFLLWNLQTLEISAEENVVIMAPSEIWEMPNLRHLIIHPRICVPDPPPSSDQHHDLVLHNLDTFVIVKNLRLSEEVCKRIPNIKLLQLCYDDKASSSTYYCLHNLCRFKQLKSLGCDFKEMLNWSDFALNLPTSLHMLSLRSRFLDWEHLSMIATMVPHLEALELRFWESNRGQFKGEFPCLKSLVIICEGDFIEWNAENSHFPVLEDLSLTRYRLGEIPPELIEIPTLINVELEECSASAAVSVVKILVEQEELGNLGFQLQLLFWTHFDEDRFWEMVEQEDLRSSNITIKNSHRTNTTIRMESRA